MRRPILLVDIAAKVLLLGLLLHAVVFPDLPQYTGKGIGYRLALYPLSVVMVPALWAWRRRRKPALEYPAHISLCVTLPFLIDTAGNAANLYDTVAWWDDLMHVITWIPLVIAIGFCFRYRPLSRPVVAGLTVGLGAVLHILWEVGEYLTFVQGNPEEAASAYRDTIGDLVGSLCGGIIGAALVAGPLWRLGDRRKPASAA